MNGEVLRLRVELLPKLTRRPIARLVPIGNDNYNAGLVTKIEDIGRLSTADVRGVLPAGFKPFTVRKIALAASAVALGSVERCTGCKALDQT